ncbi:calcium-transporting P [Cantharellus anzutake]|uniref:calcium-transporting P n=1 Tax=Cantharellus anzutake TaxID=1750568 RepID=UPI001904E8D5|nr:calcium-transporting P [Cantharellus anzutake]KAF8342682.1 calcium-transporting P [Cantharellus anzutake]
MASHFSFSTTLRRHTQDTYGGVGVGGGGGGGGGGFSPLGNVVHSIQSRAERFTASGGTGIIPFLRMEFCDGRLDTLQHFRVDPSTGLASSVVPDLRNVHGYNEFSVAPSVNLAHKFIETIYESPLNLLLLGSAFISAVMGNIDDAVSITIALLIVLTVGFVQERRSEQSLQALNRLVPHHCHLLRDSRQKTVLANELLPGDIVSFTVGDRIPSDVRLITALDLELDESSLTGESHAVRKAVEPSRFGAPLGERTSMAFMGTLVRNGRGAGVTIATGQQTEFGAIFTTMQEIEEKRTPLQISMDELATKLSTLSFAIIGVICLIGVIQSRGWLEMFTIGVSLAVAAIPEGLPIVTTVTLALGVLRMARRKAIVKKLPSVEALGSVSVICCDKTGTLTKNEQTVTEIYTIDELVKLDAPVIPAYTPALLKTVQIGALCNSAIRNSEGVYVGQSTDVALMNVLDTLQVPSSKVDFSVSAERPFNSELKSMAVSGKHASESQEKYYIKGALEAILPRCKWHYISSDVTPELDTLTRSLIVSKAESVSSRGLRVIVMAYGKGSNLVFAGFQAMMDPPRREVSDSIASLRMGGVQVIMITGDAVETALAIARQLGLLGTMSFVGCLTGKEMDEMDDRMLRERVAGITVFARTTPRHKMRIVSAFQSRGAVVAMTGDGVNDAPALKMADIGVAMGSGTDVAKEAADVILVDDNFGTILAAVEEGKSIFHNIQHFLSFQLSTAVSALTLITLSTLFELSNPQSLGVDPADRAVMRRPPRPKNAPIITRPLILRVLFSASVMLLLTLFVYMYELSDGKMSRRDQTMTFTCFVFLDLASAIQNRGLGCGITQNKMLLTTVSTSFLVQLALIYVPLFQSIFQTEALDSHDIFVLLTLAGVALALHEARRRWERQKNKEPGWDHANDLA